MLALHVQNSHAVVKLIATVIRDNVNGNPIIHQTQQWPFHPEDGLKRNPEFEALHGHRAYYLIERLGLGQDGHQAERKYEQMIRDLGVTTTSYDQPQPLYDEQQLQL